jgi:hypothetical protein
MISRGEIVPYGVTLTESQEQNINKLLVVMNAIRAEYGLLMIVTSGFRTAEDEKRIDPAHPESMHTKGAAVDIYDPDPEKRLWQWCMAHMEFLVEKGVWLEDRLYTPNHVHFQIWPPASGNRIFKP